MQIGMASLLLMGAALVGTTPSRAANELVAPFRHCGTISASTERLACFDNALQGLDQREVVAEQAQREREKATYGLSQREIEEQASVSRANQASVDISRSEGTKGREVSESADGIQSDIAEVFVQESSGQHILVLKNGQVWRETQISTYRGRPKAGMAITINRGTVGGYRLKFDGKSGFLGVVRIK